MLRADSSKGDGRNNALFRDPVTGKLITCDETRDAFAQHVEKAGLKDLQLTAHGLRVGGATSLIHTTDGGDMAAALAGWWRRNARRSYF